MAKSIENQILEQEEMLKQAKRTLDVDALQKTYADDLIMTSVLGDPTCGKAAVIDEAKRGVEARNKAIASGKPFEASADHEDLKVTAFGDTAVATYRSVVRLKGENLDAQRRYRTTNVWAKRDGQWQIVVAHMAFVIDPKQAAALNGL